MFGLFGHGIVLGRVGHPCRVTRTGVVLAETGQYQLSVAALPEAPHDTKDPEIPGGRER